MEHLIRKAWRTGRYTSHVNEAKKFLVEDTAKAHVHRLNQFMADDYAWASVAMISLLSADSDAIGSWAEGCPCHPLPSQDLDRKEQIMAKREAQQCQRRCCRAPELASGQALKMLCARMIQHKSRFTQYLSRAPASKQAELNSSWETACSKLFGYLSASSASSNMSTPES